MPSNTTDYTASRSTKNRRLLAVSKTPLRSGATAGEYTAVEESGGVCGGECAVNTDIPPYAGVGVAQEYIDGYAQYAAVVNPHQTPNDWLLFDNAGLIYGANSDFTGVTLIGVSPVNVIKFTTNTPVVFNGTYWFMLGNDNITVLRSLDGKTWTNATSIAVGDLNGTFITGFSVDELSNFYILYTGNVDYLLKSTNNGNSASINVVDYFTNETGAIITRNNTVLIGAGLENSEFQAIKRTDFNLIAYTIVLGIQEGVNSIIYDGTRYIAVTNGFSGKFLYTSPDGTTWTSVTTTGISSRVRSIVYHGGIYIISQFSLNNSVLYSANLTNWNNINIPTGLSDNNIGLESVVPTAYIKYNLHSNTLGYFGFNDDINQRFSTSTNGTSWSQLVNTVNGNTFVAGFPRVFDPTRAHI